MSPTAAGWDELHLLEEPAVELPRSSAMPTYDDGLLTTPVNSL